MRFPGIQSVTEDFDVVTSEANELYEAMDWSLARQPQMEHQLNQPHLAAGRQVFNDVSSSYYV